MKLMGIVLGGILTFSAWGESSLFKAPGCNVDLAVEELAAKAKPIIRPLETIVPWPDVFGSWINRSLGLHIQIRFSKNNFIGASYVKVEIRSVCDNRLIASGSRRIKKDDSRDFLQITLKDLVNENRPLSLKIFPPAQGQTEAQQIKLELHYEDGSCGGKTENISADALINGQRTTPAKSKESQQFLSK
jgi:hypothetical protein